MRNITKKYTNGEVTIVWQPNMCCHSGLCAQTLPKVFRPMEKPWIVPENGTTEQIVDTIKLCPSGALSYKMNDQE
ncbi:MAG: (4Fe-4S)-binding protein [Bacteroidales bacterium]|jgi:uncharacterized Fe-S cluster protein YjdI|nr:(4Fe-4S)-binding protein [Bacteroidales bacterium]